MSYADWKGMNWGSGAPTFPAAVDGLRLVNRTGPSPTSPMFATTDNQGAFIGYDTAYCVQMGAATSFFVLLHGVGHIYHRHVTTPRVTGFGAIADSRGREVSADHYACARLIDDFADDAGEIYTAAHTYFVNSNGAGGDEHPPDRERAVNMENQWSARCAVIRKHIIFADSDISHLAAASVLTAFGINFLQQTAVLAEIERTGSIRFKGLGGIGFTFGEALSMVSVCRTAVQNAGSTGTLRLSIVPRTDPPFTPAVRLLQAQAMDTIPPPEVFYVTATRVACDGDEEGGPNGHPLVYLQMGPSGFADCGYCDRRFVLTGGPADLR